MKMNNQSRVEKYNCIEDMETEKLEEKINNLTIQLYNKEREIDVLKEEMDKLVEKYEHVICKLVMDFYK